MKRGPNDSVECPSESCRRNSLAHGVICRTCDPTHERSIDCPACGTRQVEVGGVVQAHDFQGTGYSCPQSSRPLRLEVAA